MILRWFQSTRILSYVFHTYSAIIVIFSAFIMSGDDFSGHCSGRVVPRPVQHAHGPVDLRETTTSPSRSFGAAASSSPVALPSFASGASWRAACRAIGIDPRASWAFHSSAADIPRPSIDPRVCEMLCSWNLHSIVASPLLTFNRVGQLLVHVAALSFSHSLPPGLYPGATLPGVPVAPPGEGGTSGTGEADVGVAALQDVCGAIPAVVSRRCLDEWPALKAGATVLLRNISICASGLTSALFDSSGSAAPPTPGTVTGVAYAQSGYGHGVHAVSAAYGSLSFAGEGGSSSSAATRGSWGSLGRLGLGAGAGARGYRHGPDAVVKYLVLLPSSIVAVWPPSGGTIAVDAAIECDHAAPHNPWVEGEFA